MPRTANLPIFLDGAAAGPCRTRSIAASAVHPRRAHRRRPRLPSTRALAADLGVSRTTALLALEQLRAEGYVVARRGSGMFIAPEPPEHARRAVAPLAHPRHASAVLAARLRCCRACARPTAAARVATACAFRLGTPALDLFPHRTWSQITRECLRA